MIEGIVDCLIECVCGTYCTKCKEDDDECVLEEDIKKSLRKQFKEYLEN